MALKATKLWTYHSLDGRDKHDDRVSKSYRCKSKDEIQIEVIKEYVYSGQDVVDFMVDHQDVHLDHEENITTADAVCSLEDTEIALKKNVRNSSVSRMREKNKKNDGNNDR